MKFKIKILLIVLSILNFFQVETSEAQTKIGIIGGANFPNPSSAEAEHLGLKYSRPNGFGVGALIDLPLYRNLKVKKANGILILSTDYNRLGGKNRDVEYNENGRPKIERIYDRDGNAIKIDKTE